MTQVDEESVSHHSTGTFKAKEAFYRGSSAAQGLANGLHVRNRECFFSASTSDCEIVLVTPPVGRGLALPPGQVRNFSHGLWRPWPLTVPCIGPAGLEQE